MTVLGIETATMVCGAALIRDGRVVADKWVEERFVHAERLFGLIDDVLSEGKCALRGLDALAVSIGPGSFTGLRIGLSAIKGLHLALGTPVVAVPTLTALAQRGIPHFAGRQGHIVAALDARRDEVYSQLFSVDGGRMRETEAVHARTVRELVAALPEGELLLTGDARQKVASTLLGNTPGVRESRERGGVVLADASQARCSAAEVALMGELFARSRQFADPDTLEPQYVREVFLRSPH